MNVQNLNNSG